MSMKKIVLFALLVSSGVFVVPLQAQNKRQLAQNYNAWFMYFGSHKFSSKWGVHLEAQLRRSDWGGDAQQLLLRGGINYHLNDKAFATAGYCFVETYPYGAFAVQSAFPENRLWEQIQLKNQLNRFEIISRYRLEQRYVHAPVLQSDGSYKPGDAVYSNRFRLLSRVSVPFKGQTIADNGWYLTFYDEFMVSFGKNVAFNLLDQNRAYAAIGCKLPKLGRLELGYLNQLLVKGDGVKVENNHTLQLGLSSNLPLR